MGTLKGSRILGRQFSAAQSTELGSFCKILLLLLLLLSSLPAKVRAQRVFPFLELHKTQCPLTDQITAIAAPGTGHSLLLCNVSLKFLTDQLMRDGGLSPYYAAEKTEVHRTYW